MNILYIHPAGVFGGASKSLVETFRVLSREGVRGTVLCPLGAAAEAFRDAGLDVVQTRGLSQLDNTRYGFYRGLRWLVFIRELLLLPSTWIVLRKLLKKHQFDIVHLNEATLLPWARLIRHTSGIPVVIHVRSLQRGEVDDFRTRWFRRALSHNVDKVIAIDETVRRTLTGDLDVSVIHNGLQISSVVDRRNDGVFRVGIVGVLLKLKGIYEFIEAARILIKERGLNIEFSIVGENARALSGWKVKILSYLDLAHDVRADLEYFIHNHGLAENVRLTGFVSNVEEIYSKIDLLCFPSHLNAAGRPVFEAAFFGVPSIVAARNPPADTIIDGETGLCIDHSDSVLLADAIEKLYNDRSLLARLGSNAQELAERNFDIEKNAEELLALYHEVLGSNQQY